MRGNIGVWVGAGYKDVALVYISFYTILLTSYTPIFKLILPILVKLIYTTFYPSFIYLFTYLYTSFTSMFYLFFPLNLIYRPPLPFFTLSKPQLQTPKPHLQTPVFTYLHSLNPNYRSLPLALLLSTLIYTHKTTLTDPRLPLFTPTKPHLRTSSIPLYTL